MSMDITSLMQYPPWFATDVDSNIRKALSNGPYRGLYPKYPLSAFIPEEYLEQLTAILDIDEANLDKDHPCIVQKKKVLARIREGLLYKDGTHVYTSRDINGQIMVYFEPILG